MTNHHRAGAALAFALALTACGSGAAPQATTVPATASTVAAPASTVHDHGAHHHHDHGGGADEELYARTETANGFSLARATDVYPAAAPVEIRFAIFSEDGVVTGFDTVHEAPMHVLMVSSDLVDYQHLHPQMDPDGTWVVRTELPRSGSWRLVADFTATGAEPTTLGTWIHADAAAIEPASLGADSTSATDGPLTVTVHGTLSSTEETSLHVMIDRDGEPLDTVEPYLGAGGHLVAFSAADYAYVHLHPDTEFTNGAMSFTAPKLAAATWKLFLQVKVDGEVRTFPFVITAGP